MPATQLSSRQFRSPQIYTELNDLLSNLPKTADAALIADVLAECATPSETLIVGITGSVAAGKSTFCASIADHLRSTMRVEIVSTDGFLLSNAELAERGLLLRKGYPESYDANLLSGALQRARWGAVCAPGYSHTTYDRAADLDRTIDRPDILLVEGLGLSPTGKQRDPSAFLDLLIYIDAKEQDLETWFVRRFMSLWSEAETNPGSFYARFRTMTKTEADAFARQIWAGINLPNLREHIAPARQHADLLITKSANHDMQLAIPAFRANA
jgi:type I pantothenate kinase